jgi:Flp pilus assembly protein TadG
MDQRATKGFGRTADPAAAQRPASRRPVLTSDPAKGSRRSRGQALVELALVLPVLLLLVLAALDLGRIFFAQITIANTAREGAYEAAYGGSYIAGAACGSSNSVMCAVLNEAQGSLTVAPADVVRTCTGAGGCATGAYGDVVTIKVTGHFSLLTPILAAFFGGTNVAFSSTASADIVNTPNVVAGATAGPTAAPTAAPTATVLPTATPFPTPSGVVSATPSPSAPTCSPPVPNFTFTVSNKKVDFVSTSTPTSGTCQITFWRWEYGDGATDAGGVVFATSSHTYGSKATFSVILTVTNPYGSVSITKSVTTG